MLFNRLLYDCYTTDIPRQKYDVESLDVLYVFQSCQACQYVVQHAPIIDETILLESFVVFEQCEEQDA
jgi:hypothetical protein